MLMSLLLKPPPHQAAPPPHMEGAAAAAAGVAIVFGIIGLLLAVVIIASLWKIFTKAGQPGWMALVPILNIITLLNIIGKPVWWLVLFIIPLANFYVAIMMPIELAKAFGQSTGFAIGLLLLPVVFYPMLAFGSAAYRGPVQGQGMAPAY